MHRCHQSRAGLSEVESVVVELIAEGFEMWIPATLGVRPDGGCVKGCGCVDDHPLVSGNIARTLMRIFRKCFENFKWQ